MEDNLHLNKQKEEVIQIQKQEEQQLQQGDQLQDAQQQEQLQQEDQLNLQLQQNAQQLYQPAKATKIAKGRPQENQTIRKKSFKEKRRDAKLDKQVKKQYGAGDHVTLQLQTQISNRLEERNNALHNFSPQADQKRVDKRVLGAFSQGYKLVNGQPATPEDAQAKEADDEFMEDYISCDLQKREKHLDRMVDDLLESKVHPHMLDGEFLAQNGGNYKDLCDRICYMENVMKDPINKPYFENMEAEKKAKLDRLFDPVNSPYMIFSLMYSAVTGTHCVDTNSGEISTEPSFLETQQGIANIYRQNFLNACKNFKL